MACMMRMPRVSFPAQTYLAGGLFAGSLVFAAAAVISTQPATAQQPCSVEFVARVSPTGGHPEPVRGQTFYLLRKSFQDIEAEATAAEPMPKKDDYIDGLGLSPEMKAWMKKHHLVEFSGDDFVKAMAPDDVLDIPELKQAYMERNSGDRTVSLPQPKYRGMDRSKNPAKYDELVQEYHDALKKFIAANPDTLHMLYLALEKQNPGPEWKKMLNERLARVHQHALELAGTTYLAGQTDTDLDGTGRIDGIAPGEYWLSTLDNEAMAGDARVRWDLPIHVTNARSSVQLSNLNGIDTHVP
jgi:hypothetical protein